ncbi:MAG: hypothetical protein IJ306_06235 [Oscillospiraceae bacterium]|nr:hypothetical protein [Oscillospiraceae bacterium]
MPITPKVSIVLVPKEIGEKYVEDNVVKMMIISNEETVNKLNKQAFLREKQGNRRGIVATSREQLQKVADEINKSYKCS